MITEDYVSPETAMLLKEKGFDGYCDLCFNFIEIPRRIVNVPSDGKVSYEDGILKEEIVLVPTLQMAVKWLREKHNLGVFPSWSQVFGCYGCRLYYLKKGSQELYSLGAHYDTYEEAWEAGIKYCLENSI